MAQLFSTYISCPISVDIGILRKFADIAKSANSTNCKVSYWDRRETYRYENILKGCDAFILILPENGWDVHIPNLPIGCRRELSSALDSNRKIYIGYINSTGQYSIYEATVTGARISGIRGSSSIYTEKVNAFVRSIIPKEPVEYPDFLDIPSAKPTACPSYSKDNASSVYEKRLLLKKLRK